MQVHAWVAKAPTLGSYAILALAARHKLALAAIHFLAFAAGYILALAARRKCGACGRTYIRGFGVRPGTILALAAGHMLKGR